MKCLTRGLQCGNWPMIVTTILLLWALSLILFPDLHFYLPPLNNFLRTNTYIKVFKSAHKYTALIFHDVSIFIAITLIKT